MRAYVVAAEMTSPNCRKITSFPSLEYWGHHYEFPAGRPPSYNSFLKYNDNIVDVRINAHSKTVAISAAWLVSYTQGPAAHDALIGICHTCLIF